MICVPMAAFDMTLETNFVGQNDIGRVQTSFSHIHDSKNRFVFSSLTWCLQQGKNIKDLHTMSQSGSKTVETGKPPARKGPSTKVIHVPKSLAMEIQKGKVAIKNVTEAEDMVISSSQPTTSQHQTIQTVVIPAPRGRPRSNSIGPLQVTRNIQQKRYEKD